MKRQLPTLSNRSRVEIDVPTLIAVSTVAWAVVDVLHEVIGGTALLFPGYRGGGRLPGAVGHLGHDRSLVLNAN